MGLIHGAQPDALVLCHEANRPHMRGLPEYQVPSLTDCIPYFLQAARLTNPDAEFVGVCVNTSSLDDKAAEDFLKKARDETGLPTVDPIRNGVAAIVDNMRLQAYPST